MKTLKEVTSLLVADGLNANKIDREATVKICPVCYAYTYNGTKICAECMYQFYLSKKDNAESKPVAEDDDEFFDQCDREGDQ